MKIIGFTCTYNEQEYIPYVMPYIKAFGYDRFIVYDNCSTDRTAELLENYPFVEVVKWDTDGKFDDEAKTELQKKAFDMCKQMAEDGETIVMTFTDFDEVLYINSDVSNKRVIEEDYVWREYNCFFKNMVNLFPPNTERSMDAIEDAVSRGMMVHTVNGVRANFWVGGMKPTMIVVNDFKNIDFTTGNHYAFAEMEEGCKIKSYDDCCRMYGFHLKFIDKNALKRKWRYYVEKGKEVYVEGINNFDTIYNGQIGVSFPLENYFLQDGMMSTLQSHSLIYNGLIERGK